MTFLIHVTYASGRLRTFRFPSADDRNLFAILVRALVVDLELEDVAAVAS